MERRDNYRIQASQAKQLFLSYDQQRLIEKLGLRSDESYLYPVFLGSRYRIHRQTADFQRQDGEHWVDGNSFGEVMTLLDMICDSREDRFLTGTLKNMQGFGLQFHQNLLEEGRNPVADFYQSDIPGLRRACEALNGRRITGGDVAYAIELFDGLEIAFRFWEADDEFNASIRYFWDENALMYLKYETMYFAVGFLEQRIRELMT